VADLGFIEREVASLPRELRPTFQRIFQSILKDLRLGHPADATASTNFGAAFYEGTTPSTPGETFTIRHGFGRVPYLILPVLALDTVGAQLVPLTVQRAADADRVYLTSPVADAPFIVMLEG
jgi:hypothetical protein